MKKLTKILIPLTLSSTVFTPLVAAQCGTQASSEENMVSLAKSIDTFMKDKKQNSKTFDVNVVVSSFMPLNNNTPEITSISNTMHPMMNINSLLSQSLQSMNNINESDFANFSNFYKDILNMPADFFKMSIGNAKSPLKYLANAGEASGTDFIQKLDNFKDAEIKDLGTANINLNNIDMKSVEQANKIIQDLIAETQKFYSNPQAKPVLLKISINVKARITLNKKLNFATYADNIFSKNVDALSKIYINSTLGNMNLALGPSKDQIIEMVNKIVDSAKHKISDLDNNVNEEYAILNTQDFEGIKKLGKYLNSKDNAIFSIEFK
ncbi:hypothetical protein ACNQ2L_02470 [Mycoplasma sp. T193]|uniref:hypothetical protein n=1 Tax=unclassified Mycoplasma TaxID=2683645 RepID=UPI003AAC8DA4